MEAARVDHEVVEEEEEDTEDHLVEEEDMEAVVRFPKDLTVKQSDSEVIATHLTINA